MFCFLKFATNLVYEVSLLLILGLVRAPSRESPPEVGGEPLDMVVQGAGGPRAPQLLHPGVVVGLVHTF